jgi:hypothetical protein
MHAKSTYTVKKWEEKPYEEISPQMKMTKASVEFEMSGDLTGKASVEYLMFYKHFDEKDPHKANAVYTGLIRFTGSVNGKAGSFAMQNNGSFEGGTAKSELEIISGSGTEELESISGSGNYIANQSGFNIELDYTLSP